MNKKYKISILFLIFLLVPVICLAHPGRTNRAGCHTCRTNCTEKWGLDYGEYHCHNSGTIKKAKTTAKTEAKKESK